MEETKQPEEYFAVHIPSPDGGASNEGAVFPTLREASNFANTPESKAKGARFKRFHSPEDAENYARNGDIFCKNWGRPFAVQPAGEPTVSFPSVSRIKFNRLKNSIEKKDDELFLSMVTENPRYLINVGSDTPTIVVEGFRYNAMHLAAKSGNLYVARYVLHLVCDTEALRALYGTSEEDVKMRSRILLDCYLNMPDKGAHDTPLHFASKFGHIRLVELFLSYNICQKNPVNKMGFTPAQICCTRCHGDDQEELRAFILPLFNAYFVALYRPTDDYYSVTIQVFDELPPDPLPEGLPGSSSHIAFEICELTAYAGPFTDKELAQKFCQMWKIDERECRRSMPRKGAERVGRSLATEYKVTWMERWSFCNKLIDLQSFTGLEQLNRYLVHIRLHPPNHRLLLSTFDDDGDDVSLFTDASDSVQEGNHKNEIEKENDMIDNSSCSSLSGLTDMLASLHLDSDSSSSSDLDTSSSSDLSIDFENYMSGNTSVQTETSLLTNTSFTSESNVVAPVVEHNSDNASNDDDSSADFEYCTPPTSPEPIFIYEGIPSQDDEELAIALSLVDSQLIQRFGAVAEYVRQVRKVPATERSQWPSTDSPRAKRRRI